MSGIEHRMSPEPFSKIRDGSKTIELRLYGEKRRAQWGAAGIRVRVI